MKRMLYFTASWCGPCKAIAPMITNMIESGLPILKIDVDEQSELCQQYGINSVPTFIVIENDEVISRKVGAQSKEVLIKMLQ